MNGVTTKYTLFGDRVAFETKGSDKIHYSYDASGNLFSMNLNGTEYYYVRNAQGDIMGPIDSAKNPVVSYTYDTWEKLFSTMGSLAGTLGVKNPYRYRGYRYDTETGLYYLQSRYYNPEWGRFVNVDGITGIQGQLQSHNLFSYCQNNPVIFGDPDGEFIITMTTLIVGGMIIGGLLGAGYGAWKSHKKLGRIRASYVIGYGLGGVVVGAIAGWGAGAALTYYGILGTSYASWQVAEQGLRATYNGVSKAFNTPFGRRIVDCFSNNIARESKYGYQGLSQFIKNKIAKDSSLINRGIKVEWHFYWSQVSNSGGPSGPLRKALQDAK